MASCLSGAPHSVAVFSFLFPICDYSLLSAQHFHSVTFIPDFLSGKHFFLYGKFPNNERRLLLRYIVAFNG